LQYDEIESEEGRITDALSKASERDKLTRSIFAQHAIKADEIDSELKDIDESIGNPADVRQFVLSTISLLGAQYKKYKEGYIIYTTNLPLLFKSILKNKDEVLVSFESPTPEGFKYLGRNHIFVEQLCHYVLNNSLSKDSVNAIAARASVIPSTNINVKTTILQLRVRNIISEKTEGKQLVAEEMLLWGYEGNIEDKKYHDAEYCKSLLREVVPSSDFPKQRQEVLFNNEIQVLKNSENVLKDVVRIRSNNLIESHERFRKLVGGNKYHIVEPVLPPDVLGIYIIVPQL